MEEGLDDKVAHIADGWVTERWVNVEVHVMIAATDAEGSGDGEELSSRCVDVVVDRCSFERRGVGGRGKIGIGQRRGEPFAFSDLD